MGDLVEKEDWEALIGVLQEGIGLLDRKEAEPVKQAILQFASTAAMLGLQDLADVSKRFEAFLLEKVAPGWKAEPTGTLSFTMGSLLEKMQMHEYSPQFSGELDEILLYLDFYAEEEPSVSPSPALSAIASAAAFSVDRPSSGAVEGKGSSRDRGPELTPSHKAESEPAQPSGILARRDMGFVMDRVDWFRQMLRSDPTSQAFVSLAEEYCYRGQWKKAAETCRKGLAAHPHLLRGRILLGWALWGMGKAGEAEQTLTEARVELEASGMLYKILAEIAESHGEKKNARELMEIYDRLGTARAGGLALRLTARPMDEIPQEDESPLLELLSALMDRFKAAPIRQPEKPSLFSATDRKALKGILSAMTH